MPEEPKAADARWIPLESNPEVLNNWSSKVGLVRSQDEFTDVYGLDDELLAFVPRPVKAVVLLFPLIKPLEDARRGEDEKVTEGALPPVDPTIIWMKQTIGNACGTIGLLHALMNSNVTIVPESPLAQFIEHCKDKSPLERAKLLETTHLFADIHDAAARTGQTVVPTNLDTEYHFTCFVQAPSSEPDQAKGLSGRRLVELDGRRKGPIDRGPSDDLLKDVAKFVKEHIVKHSESMNLNMMALVAPSDN